MNIQNIGPCDYCGSPITVDLDRPKPITVACEFCGHVYGTISNPKPQPIERLIHATPGYDRN
jgi:uncharacterized Zn finger protein